MRKILDLNNLPSGRQLDLNWNDGDNVFEATLISSKGNRLRSDYGHNRLAAVQRLISTMKYSAQTSASWKDGGLRMGLETAHGKYLSKIAEELKKWLEG
jgi:hypothetical protein